MYFVINNAIELRMMNQASTSPTIIRIPKSTQKCQPKIAITVTSKILNILIGNKYFHSRFKSWSIRSLGKVHLNHMIRNISKNVFAKNQILDGIKSITWLKPVQFPICNGIHPPKNNVAPMAHTINTFTYSAKKNKANFIPEYSV